MSGKHIAKEQPKNFVFSEINLKKKDEILKKYPEQRKKSAVMPLLYLVQKQNQGWIPLAGIQYVADLLEVPYIKVFEVATFYTMYNLAPVGKYFVQVCTTTPCMIRGSGKIVDMCKKYISEKEGHLSEDKKRAIRPEVESPFRILLRKFRLPPVISVCGFPAQISAGHPIRRDSSAVSPARQA